VGGVGASLSVLRRPWLPGGGVGLVVLVEERRVIEGARVKSLVNVHVVTVVQSHTPTATNTGV